MNESKFWQHVRSALNDYFFLQRLENMVGEGVPDVMYHSRVTGAGGLLELKSREQLPARKDTPVFPDNIGLRPAQIAWIHCRAAAGGRVWILAQCGGRVWLVHGRWAREFNGFSVQQLDLVAAWSGGIAQLSLLGARTFLY